MRLPKQAGHTRVSYPLTGANTGFFFEIAADGKPTSCGYPNVIAELSCATAVPSARALSSSQIENLDPTSSVVVLPGLRIEGIANALFHTHGGRAADLFDASFRVKVTGRAKAVRIQKAWLVRAHCMADHWSTATPLKISGVSGIKPQAPVQSAIQLKANSTTEIRFSFDRQEVYNACDYFAVRARLQVGKQSVEFEIPLEVTRFDVDDSVAP